MSPRLRVVAAVGLAAAITLVAIVSIVIFGRPGTDTVADPGSTPATGTVWVADEYGNSITVIDAATNEAVTTLTGIEGPHNLQVAPMARASGW
jgi:YVTN family beta-propeller protein